MTATRHEAIEQPEQDVARGYFADARTGYVKNLLSRVSAAGNGNQLNPEIIRKMRRHPTVASCLLVQSLPLVRADWSIECEDERIRDALTAYYKLVAFSVHRTMVRAMPDGYSPNELVWGYLDDVKLLAPYQVRDLAARTCKPAVDDVGSFDGFEQSGVTGKTETFDRIYALWITEGLAEGNYYGRSILDAAQEPWTDYAAIRAFHGRYLERFGEPVVLCRAPAGHSISNLQEIETVVKANELAGLEVGDAGYKLPPDPVLVQNMDAALETGQNLRNHSVVALPSTLLFGTDGKPTGYAWNLEFLSADKGGGSDFLDALREKKKDIATAMFVPDLLTSNGSDSGGSVANALGDTHRSVWEGAVEGRLDDYSRQITEQLLDPVRILNFGERSAAARLVFAPLTDEEKEREWQLVVALCTKGVLPIDLRELAERAGLPLSEEDPEPEPAPTPPPPADPAELAHQHAPVALALPDWQQPQAAAPAGDWFRALNNREERVGFAKIEDGLNAAERATIATLEQVLDTEHDRILAQLAGILRKGTPAEILAALGTLEVKAGPKVSAAWAELMGTVGDLALERLRAELATYAEQLPERTSTTARAMFKAYAATSAERAVTALVTETRLRLLNAYTSGVVSKPGLSAVVGQVFDEQQTSEGRPIRLTTRMLSAKSLNYSRAEAVEAGGIPLAGAQYSAILDHVTCDLCRKLDETVIAIEHTDLPRFTPPVHHNCRCMWVWITRDEADFTPTWSSPAKSLVDRFGGLVVG